MAMWCRALALWCAVTVVAVSAAAAYTVDCNHEYTDCDTELSKLTSEDEDIPTPKPVKVTVGTTEPLTLPTRSTDMPAIELQTESTVQEADVTEMTEAPKPKPRLIKLNVDELQNFANALHNQTIEKAKKVLPDLSDVNLEDDEDDPRMLNPPTRDEQKGISDKFYSNLEAPFNRLVPDNNRGSDEVEICRENDVSFKIGDRLDRGCEETCECTPGGVFECSPRCKHPYIRRGRQLNDPLCFESPVDECCSIVACATGNGDSKIEPKLEVCRYGNDTYPVGGQWYIGCDQTCTCEPMSFVTCKPRCKPIKPSDKCINVQDPNDACCEVQICDVSQDVHELHDNNTSTSSTPKSSTSAPTTSTTSTTSTPPTEREPIGSIKVLQNNTVQVNLIRLNNTENPIHLLLSGDGGKTFEEVELKYANLILNLQGGKDYVLKTKETGTKFNFTITNVGEIPGENYDTDLKGCWEDGKFYDIGEEFQIGCSQLCECTGHNMRECAALVCPNHVGLELMSKGCVRWAPSPPAQPPNCCPRSARCLSDGTCEYNGVSVPNWSEVPLSLTGCEQRCFCENGELDCQEVCSPLPPVPPQSLRCPPSHRPAAVNISDEDCCKQWGCVPTNAGSENTSSYQIYSYQNPTLNHRLNYIPVGPMLLTQPTPKSTTPISLSAAIKDLFRELDPVQPLVTTPPPIVTVKPKQPPLPKFSQGDNITVFTFNDIESPIKTLHPEPPMIKAIDNWEQKPKIPNESNIFPKSHTSISQTTHTHPELKVGPKYSDGLDWHSRTKVIQPVVTWPTTKDQFKTNIPFKINHELNIVNQGPFIKISKDPPIQVNKVVTNSMNKDSFKPNRESYITRHEEPIIINADSMRKVPISSIDDFNYFLPIHEKRLPVVRPYFSDPLLKSTKSTSVPITYFRPISFKNRSDHILTRDELSNMHKIHRTNNGRHVTVLQSVDLDAVKNSGNAWDKEKKRHAYNKLSGPYETMLLKAVPRENTLAYPRNNLPNTTPRSHLSITLEQLLNQMDLDSEDNRNIGRSADGKHVTGRGQSPIFTQKTDPPFLPTIPPIHYPHEDIPDYEQNNINRPNMEQEIPGLRPGLPGGLPGGLPPGLQVQTFGSSGDSNKKLTVISIESDSPTSIKMLLGLPPVLVGLRGSVDLRYTDKDEEDVSHWLSQVFAPADEILTTPRLEFRLTGLKPSTSYKVKGKLYLHNLPVAPESEVYNIRTMDTPSIIPLEEKRKEIDSRLLLVDVNDTTAHFTWRYFAEDELQFIDGIQVRYRPVGTPIYSMTELLHHSRSTAELHDLRPNSRYEASLVLVPPPRATTELYDPKVVEFTTQPYNDPYNWTVIIETRTIGSEAAELTWRGVPSPAERWVRVYRAAHACDDHKHTAQLKEHDYFRLAARDQQPTITITGLQSDMKCRVWLELFLTNGKVKTSNVIEIKTKSLDTINQVDNAIEASSISGSKEDNARSPRGDYYTALVGVGVVAALGALASLLLLLVVLRRHRPRSVPITPVPSAPRESSLPPYDNPAYKLELQQETMDL